MCKASNRMTMAAAAYIPKTILSIPTWRFLLGSASLVVLFFSGLLLLAALLGANIMLARLIRPLNKFAVGYGIELISLSTVVAGMAYGVEAGIIMGAISMFANFIAMHRLSTFSIFVLPIYIMMGIGAAFFSNAPIAVVGIVLVIAYNVIISSIILTGFRGSIAKCCTFSFVNIIWNLFMFLSLGAPLLALAV